jgi:hypothetical protein
MQTFETNDGYLTDYPTALTKQLIPDDEYDGSDIIVEVNSKYDSVTWYGGNEPIQANQVDFLHNILHELLHGLGIFSYWGSVHNNNDMAPFYQVSEENTNTGEFKFARFETSIFDKFLVSLDNDTPILPIVSALSNMAGPPGRAYGGVDDFRNKLLDEQHRQGKSYTTDMYKLATTPKKLGFKQIDAGSISEVIVLDTLENPFVFGVNIIHFDHDLYKASPDFIFTPIATRGKTLQENIVAYGNAPGEGIGPLMRSLLKSLGYIFSTSIFFYCLVI